MFSFCFFSNGLLVPAVYILSTLPWAALAALFLMNSLLLIKKKKKNLHFSLFYLYQMAIVFIDHSKGLEAYKRWPFLSEIKLQFFGGGERDRPLPKKIILE